MAAKQLVTAILNWQQFDIMYIRNHFEYNQTIDLTAAHIGINQWTWRSIDGEDEQRAKKIMQTNRFDILPIVNSDKTVTKYFSTRKWNNYEHLNLNKIIEVDKVYYRLTFPDLIAKFHEDKRHFYFLTNYQDVVGLVSFVNLNSQAIYHYLFQVIADIEISVSQFLKSCLDQDEIISVFASLSDPHVIDVLKQFNETIVQGKDNTIFEHMYLQTLGITIKKMLRHIPEAQKKLIKYQPKFSPNGTYGKLRNIIMHPVRPVLNDEQTISDINELLQDYNDIKNTLRLNREESANFNLL